MSSGKWAPVCPLTLVVKRPRRCLRGKCAWYLKDPGECVVARMVPALALVLARAVNRKEE